MREAVSLSYRVMVLLRLFYTIVWVWKIERENHH